MSTTSRSRFGNITITIIIISRNGSHTRNRSCDPNAVARVAGVTGVEVVLVAIVALGVLLLVLALVIVPVLVLVLVLG